MPDRISLIPNNPITIKADFSRDGNRHIKAVNHCATYRIATIPMNTPDRIRYIFDVMATEANILSIEKDISIISTRTIVAHSLLNPKRDPNLNILESFAFTGSSSVSFFSVKCPYTRYSRYNPPAIFSHNILIRNDTKNRDAPRNANAPKMPYFNARFLSLGGKSLTIIDNTAALSIDNMLSRINRLNIINSVCAMFFD